MRRGVDHRDIRPLIIWQRLVSQRLAPRLDSHPRDTLHQEASEGHDSGQGRSLS